MSKCLGRDISVRQHSKSEHWAPCHIQTPSRYDWKRLKATLSPNQTNKFSANVARHAAEARRSSTRRVYDANWKVFSDWCLQREVHPFSATLSEVADFLLHLFQEKKWVGYNLQTKPCRPVDHGPVCSGPKGDILQTKYLADQILCRLYSE